MHRNITVTLLLLFITGLSWWLMTTMQQHQEQVRIKSMAQGPNQYMEDFTAVSMNDQGQPRYELKATFMAHFTQYDRTDLTRPQFTVHEQTRPQSWVINADRGTVLNHGDEVVLRGNVVIKGRDSQEKPLHIETPSLRILPKDHFAETRDIVHITRGTSTLDSLGAKVYLEQRVLLLMSKVRGTYVPNS